MATIVKRGDSYRIVVSCGYGVDGKQVTQSMTWNPEANLTKKQIEKEVNRQAVLFEEICLKGQIVSTVKFETFAEQWFDEYAKGNLKNTSLDRMLRLRDKVYAAIGHLRLDKITSRHIQNFVNNLAKTTSEATGRRYARKTIVHHLSFISTVFGYALKMGMLTDNPCRRVTVPKGEKKEKQVYTIEETEQFLTLLQAAPLKYRLFFTLVIYSGFRLSEMLGLEWKDCNYAHCVISIRRTSNYTIDTGLYTDTTKTKKSMRSLQFPQFIMDMLKEYQAEQNAEKERLGNMWEDTDRLFTRWNGEPMTNNIPYKWLMRFCAKHNFRFCDIHSFRHLNASLLINAGVDATSVAAALGHAHTSTTLNIYAHYFQEAQAKIGNAVSNALDFSQKKEPPT